MGDIEVGEYEDQEEPDETGQTTPWARIVVVALASLAVSGALWLGGRALSDDGEETATLNEEPQDGDIASEIATTTVLDVSATVAEVDVATTASESTSTTTSTTTITTTTTTTAATEPTETSAPASSVSDSTGEDESPSPVTLSVDEPDGDDDTDDRRSRRNERRSVPFDTLPDGTPAPVTAVFSSDRITLTGAVPSEEAKERIQALAVANANPGQAAYIVNFLTVNPAVPEGTGVRVVELTSARFPVGDDEIRPAHAAELDRIASVMTALPRISVLVIAHTDQDETGADGFRLADRRADAVVRYLVDQGIAPDRLSSRAVGARDLLTLNSGRAAQALNRRTEFVLYGLLVDD